MADSYAAVDAYNGEGSVPRACRPSPTGCGPRLICDAMLRSAASREWVTVG